jgi:hypothetical protein
MHSSFEPFFKGKRLIRGSCGWICPHKGISLASMVPDESGVITRPLHGLRWKASDGAPAW